ncbi:hypothetical protein HZH68_012698 [Vespula germanica]|uniref:Odorant receptor n=1 Tax=Vespula germanica TaxID=30212 RepID=A0A834JNU0_VESGE|nr:hypothetical protein HZH68_012698 [Vespula germanica]
MSLRGLSYYEQHFFLTNRLVQLLIGLRPSQSSHEQLLLVSVVTLYVLPAIVHQFYQLFISDVTLEVNVKELQKMLSGISILYVYSTTYFSFVTMKFIIVRFKEDYDQLSDENELNIFKNYTKQSKLYTYIIIVFSNFYIFLNIFPYILNVFFHIFGTLDDNELTLPIPVNNILKPGMWKIRRPFKNDRKHVENDRSDTTLQEEWDWMIDIIKCYTRITELMFQLSVVLQSASETIKCCIYMAGSISTIYISYYVGQLLIDHSNDAFMELCQIPFYTLSIKTQKLLLLLLIRSIKPSEISIGVNARHFTMLPIGLSYYERHFLFSNRLLQFFLGLNSRDQFFMLCAIIGYLLPLIVHQFYQLYTTDKQLQPTIKVLESLIPGLYIIYCYITVYFSLTTIKLLLAHIKFDYEFVRNEMELNIMEKYTNKILLYLYLISITFPSILSVFLYIFGTSGSIHLTLPFSIDNVLQAGCNIPFYNFSVQTQKLLLLLLIRSIKPTELSIGGMFVVSHEVFAGIVQKAYSFAAIYYNTIKTSTILP